MASSSSNSGSRDKKMLLKFQSKSARVKGLSFHPQRPWILASLHNGTIQLWDWRMEVMIDKFEEHDGPVRGIHFHPSQPLFVSGGDDYKIKVWNYQQRRCLFTLLGHLDYIRTVFFHPELPWIISASDDQTIRIWNWQNHQCLSVLTGHNHYVMCAQWHPTENLIVSASLDATVRVWDFTPLKERVGGAGKSGSLQTASNSNQSDELFGQSDVNVKHTLEGFHSRGVNWASFHRTLPLIVSGADDREVKVFRYNDVKAWEVDTLRGHMNNVSCVLFHPKKDIIVSNSEDKTIRVWDLTQGQSQAPLVFRRDDNRFWVLEAHPNLNLLAAGHDSGLIVFKLNRERPAYDISTSLTSSTTTAGPQTHTHTHLYYLRDIYVYEYNFRTQKERPVLTIRRRTSNSASPYGSSSGPALSSYYKTLSYCDISTTHHAFLLTSESEGSYELYTTAKSGQSSDEPIPQKGFCKQAIFVSRSRFAILDKQRNLWLKNMKNETKKKIELGQGTNINSIFYGGVGRIILRVNDTVKSESKLVLYDVHAMRVISELPSQSRHAVKYAVWSADHKHLALFSKANLYLTNSKMEDAVCINENSRIKSGSWDSLGVFVYTTHTHIKYVLPNGESGVLRTLEQPIYATAVLPAPPSTTSSTTVPANQLRTLFFLERSSDKPSSLTFESTEYQFKHALVHQKNAEVKRILESGRIKGESMISYLEKKGYPEVALQFVSDTTTKFLLALSCGNIDVALECAQQLDAKGEGQEAWLKLGQEALRQGNIQVVEAAYLKTKSFAPLSFLYLITGQTDKLAKMKQIAVSRGDMQGRFMNSLYLGDVEERIQVLRESGQYALAYVTAVTNGLEEIAEAIKEEMGENAPDSIESMNLPRRPSNLILPPVPILRQGNWPLLDIKKGFFDRAEQQEQLEKEEEKAEAVDSDNDDLYDFGTSTKSKTNTSEAKQSTSSWGDDLDIDIPKADSKSKSAWGDDFDIDIEATEEEALASTSFSSSSSSFVMPLPGKSPASALWPSSPLSLACDLIAAGQFDMAMHMLKRECGIVNFGPLKDLFMSIWQGSRIQATLSPFAVPYSTPLSLPLLRSQTDQSDLSRMPEPVMKLPNAVELLRNGSKLVGEGQFPQAQTFFTQLLHCLPLIRVDKKAQQNEVIELLNVAREYSLFLRLEAARREAQADASAASQTRAAALACYLTHCALQPKHTLLALRVALKCCYTIKNYKTSALICRRIIELSMQHAQTLQSDPKDAELVDTKKIRAILAQCEKVNTDEQAFDYPDPLVLDCKSLTPIPRGPAPIRCSYCNATYLQKEDQTLCVVCGLARVGGQATGLRNYSE